MDEVETSHLPERANEAPTADPADAPPSEAPQARDDATLVAQLEACAELQEERG